MLSGTSLSDSRTAANVRCFAPRRILLLGALSLLFIGCQRSGDGEYKTFEEIEQRAASSKPSDVAPSPQSSVSEKVASSDETTDRPNSNLPPLGAADLSTEVLPDTTKMTPIVDGVGLAKKADEPNEKQAETAMPDRPVTAPTNERVMEGSSMPNKDASPESVVQVQTPNASSSAEMSAEPGAPPMIQPLGRSAIKLLIPEKVFTTEGKENALRVSFDDIDLLKVLNMEPVVEDVGDFLPDWLKGLHGKKIVLRGWMYPPARQDGIGSFMFVRDNGICCFGRAPKVYDKLGVKLKKGVTTKYIQNRPFDVVGTLSIEPEVEGDDEGLWWLYFIEDAIVIDN